MNLFNFPVSPDEQEEVSPPAASSLVDTRSTPQAVASLLTPPKSPLEQARENHGGAGFMLKAILGGMTGTGAMLLPEFSRSNKAKYEADLKNHNSLMSSQLENDMLTQQVAPLEAMLDDDDETNDLGAIRSLARYQPDIYGPVLREMSQSNYNPTPETYTEGDYQINPETGLWELVQQGSLGNIKRTPMPEGFVPESRMWSPDAREKAIGEADTAAQDSYYRVSNLQDLGTTMDEIGAENWTAGMRGELGEKWKEATGAQDKISMARKQYEGIRTSQAVQNLPPGVASDKDIELVLAPFPTSFTNFEELREYVRRLETGERKLMEYKQFESRYLTNKGTRAGLLDTWQSDMDRKSGDERSAYFDRSKKEKDDDFDTLWGG